MVTEVDATCGRIMEELEKQNVMDKTLVIFTTDNGNFHGKNAWTGQHSLLRLFPHQISRLSGEHGLAEKCRLSLFVLSLFGISNLQ